MAARRVARRALEWIGMFKGLAGFLDMKYQTCSYSDISKPVTIEPPLVNYSMSLMP